MRITIPARAFHQAAIRKRKGQSDEAEGSRKRPRSRSPPAPRTAPRLPTPSPPPRQSPAPSPPPPPRRSATPLPPPPPPRRSPTPLPPRRSPASLPPSEPFDLTVGTPPEESTAHTIQPTGHRDPPPTGPTPREVPQASGGAPIDRKQKAVVGYEARTAASEPTGDRIGPVSSRPSLMNHPHLAEKLLAAASTPAIREEIMRTNSRILFKDCHTALLRMVNIISHTQALFASGERRLERCRRETIEYRERATKAEDALKLAQAGEADRHEIVRSQARAESEAAHQQMRKALERAFTAEGKLTATEAELAGVKAQLEAARSELKSAEEKVEIAEEVARLADIRIAEAKEAVKAADKKSSEAEAAARAAEGKAAAAAEEAVKDYRSSQAFIEEVAGAAEKAVENYRSSQVFIQEVAEAGAGAYLQGYYNCRDKAVRVFGVEGLKDLEPEEGDLEDEGVNQGSAPTAEAAPTADATSPKN